MRDLSLLSAASASDFMMLYRHPALIAHGAEPRPLNILLAVMADFSGPLPPGDELPSLRYFAAIVLDKTLVSRRE